MSSTNLIIFPIVTFFIGWIPGAAIGTSDLLRAKLNKPPMPKSYRSDLMTNLIGLVLIVIIGSFFWQQKEQNECQARANADYSSGIAARSEAARVSTVAVIDAHNANITYLDKLGRYLDLVELSGLAQDQAAPRREYRQAISDLRAAEVEVRDTQVEINRVRNATQTAPAPVCD